MDCKINRNIVPFEQKTSISTGLKTFYSGFERGTQKSERNKQNVRNDRIFVFWFAHELQNNFEEKKTDTSKQTNKLTHLIHTTINGAHLKTKTMHTHTASQSACNRNK